MKQVIGTIHRVVIGGKVGPVLLAAILGLAFQGSRGLWEPDEGYYSNVAVGMLQTGDGLVPRLNGDPFLDKPPLHYWTMAAGMRLFGINEWGARIPEALWFLATVALVTLLGESLWETTAGRLAGLIYATSLMPFIAANLLTPDTSLTFWVCCSMLCYLNADRSAGGLSRAAWWLSLGGSTGLGILMKGPAMLLFVAPLVVHFMIHRRRGALCPWPAASALTAVVIGGSWYALVAYRLPGAGAYFLDSQVVGRLFSSHYRRNSGLLRGLEIYIPVLALGVLPWSVLWPFELRGLRARLFRKPAPGEESSRTANLLVGLWFAIPLVVLVAARSRLPLYALPLVPALALMTARRALTSIRAWDEARWVRLGTSILAVWCVCLLGVKAGAGRISTSRDTRPIAVELDRRLPDRSIEIVAVDRKLNALRLYGFTDLEWVTFEKENYPFFAPVETLAQEIMGAREENVPHVYLVPLRRLAKVERLMKFLETTCERVAVIDDLEVLACGGGHNPGRSAS